MDHSFETARQVVRELAADFGSHQDSLLSSNYSELALRQDYLDKLFTALGWDVTHTTQKNPFRQEVRVEKNVVDGSAKRRADYAFYVNPNFRDAKFYVEAKKPTTALASLDNYFQAIRYGWNSQVPLVILTDFQELHILDCRYKPDIDTILERRIKRYHFSEYSDPRIFAEIYYLFAREEVASGSLDKYVDSLPKRRGKRAASGFPKAQYQKIDEAFLEELDSHREVLARTLKRENPSLTGEILTEITQRILDRLVFVRFLEDKLIEPEQHISALGHKQNSWPSFLALSRKLDSTYNGIVFKKHPVLDSDGLVVDNKVFSSICQRLAHANSPYDFNAIPIHILGSIYERFLGKVIVVTEKRARLEEKPEVRKAGGVYYTPEYIVHYIAEETVRSTIQGKTPTQIASMRFLDIACGSGSFLLGVYDVLLQYHRDWFNTNPQKAKDEDCVKHTDGTLHLTLGKRREILLNNIFGIDLDSQAVEVAQLSLYLKLLEEESLETARTYQLEFHTTLLPSLADNVLCGNSLIEPDILEGGKVSPDLERLINPLDIKAKLHRTLAKGGFDAIVGNPPYVRPHRISPLEKEYLWDHYSSFTHKADLYTCFLERATSLLRPGGRLGYILSRGWLLLNSFQALRLHLLSNYRIQAIVDLPYRVFADASVDTAIVLLEKDAAASRWKTAIDIREGTLGTMGAVFRTLRHIPQRAFKTTFQNVFDISLSSETENVKEKMRKGPKLGDVFRIAFGLKTGDDSRFLHSTPHHHVEDRPLLRGEDINRYAVDYKGEYVWYVPAVMRSHRKTARPGEPQRFEQPKVLVKDTTTQLSCAYDDQGYYVKDALIIIPASGTTAPIPLRAIAGLINSKAMTFYFRTTFSTIHVQTEELASLPLPLPAMADQHYPRLVSLVDQLERALAEGAKAQTHKEQERLRAKADTLDHHIDQLVYLLYGLDQDDVGVVEQHFSR